MEDENKGMSHPLPDLFAQGPELVLKLAALVPRYVEKFEGPLPTVEVPKGRPRIRPADGPPFRGSRDILPDEVPFSRHSASSPSTCRNKESNSSPTRRRTKESAPCRASLTSSAVTSSSS